MFSWLFGSSQDKESTLILKPDESGRKYAGFLSGESLVLKGNTGETVGVLMERFNTYRGPDQQITNLWTAAGAPLPFSTILNGTLTAIVSKK